MSLLNEMLKDLKENKDRMNPPFPTFIPCQKPSLMQKLPMFLLGLLGALMVGLIILWIIHGFHLTQHQSWPTHPLVIDHKIQNVLDQASPPNKTSITSTPSLLSSKPETKPILAQNQQTYASLGANSENLPPETMPSRLIPIQVSKTEIAPKPEWSARKNNALKPADNLNKVHKVFAAPSIKEWHDMQLNQALEALQEGDEEHAIRLLELILTKLPASTEARESLAAIYLSRAQLSKTMSILDEGLHYAPHSLGLNKMKARLLFEQDRAQDALKLLEPYKPDIRYEPDFYGLIAAVLQTVGRLDEAGRLYQSLVEIDPSNGQYWLGYAIALEQKQAYQQAIPAYQRASQSYDIDPAIRAYAESRLKLLLG